MSTYSIPEAIMGFNVYRTGNRLMGISGEVSLASMESVKAAISGAGMLGEYSAPVPGHFSDMEQAVPFRTLTTDCFPMLAVGADVDLTLRGAMRMTDGNGRLNDVGLRIVMRGRSVKFEPGKLKVGETMDAAVTLSLTYFLIEFNGKNVLELDKLNSVYKVDGTDMLSQIRSLC